MAIDVNGQFTGSLYGQDRIGQTTPDLESSEWLRPWIPVAYPAPYLPTLRQDQGHPKLAGIVIGSHMLVGQDKNGGLVPAGLFCGNAAITAPAARNCAAKRTPAPRPRRSSIQETAINRTTPPISIHSVGSCRRFVRQVAHIQNGRSASMTPHPPPRGVGTV